VKKNKKIRKAKLRVPVPPPSKPFKVKKGKNRPKRVEDEDME